MTDEVSRGSAVVQPEGGESYWQPVPANGHVELKASSRDGPVPFDCGVQSVAPGGYVREHAHDGHDELIFVQEGTGIATVAGKQHPMRPGTTLHLKSMDRHTFVNTGTTPLAFFWVLMPGGLGPFFSRIGRPRAAGDPAPSPFPRPEDVKEIEATSVFASASGPK